LRALLNVYVRASACPLANSSTTSGKQITQPLFSGWKTASV